MMRQPTEAGWAVSPCGVRATISSSTSAVEQVGSTRFLGVHISDDLPWNINTSFLDKKSQQRKRYYPYNAHFLQSTINWILSSCIIVWYGACTTSCQMTRQRTVGAVGRIASVPLPSLKDIYNTRLIHRATRIACIHTYPSNILFSLLPLGRRLQSLQAKTGRLKDNVLYRAVRMLNSLLALPTLPPWPLPPLTPGHRLFQHTHTDTHIHSYADLRNCTFTYSYLALFYRLRLNSNNKSCLLSCTSDTICALTVYCLSIDGLTVFCLFFFFTQSLPFFFFTAVLTLLLFTLQKSVTFYFFFLPL